MLGLVQRLQGTTRVKTVFFIYNEKLTFWDMHGVNPFLY